MVMDALLTALFRLIETILNVIPFSDINIDYDAVKPFVRIISMCIYFFPWKQVFPIIVILVLVQSYRIVISLLRVIWDVLPFT